MVRNLLSIFCCLIALGLQAQLSLSPESIDVTASHFDEKIEMDLGIVNASQETAEFYWRLVNADEMPDAWEVSICDFFLCYPKESMIFASPDSKINEIDADTSGIFNFYVYPNKSQAEFTYLFELFDINDPENVYASMDIYVSTLSTSTHNVQEYSNSLNIFPNPTTEYFQIENDDHIDRVAIYNIVGKQIESYNHDLGRKYDVTDFKKGIYLVRLFDQGGDVLKTLRLNRG